MSAKLTVFLAALLAPCVAGAARADFIYTYTTTTSAGAGGTLSITIDAPNSAVQSGHLSSANISSLTLHLTGTSSPFVNFTDTHVTDLMTPATVNPVTGNILQNGIIDATSFIPPSSLEVVLVDLILGSTDYHVGVPATNAMGVGTWAVTAPVTPVPEPATLSLAGSAAFALAVGAFANRFRKRQSALP